MLRRRTEIIPGKNSDTRIKPLPLTNGHGRYITVTSERTLVSVREWPLHISDIEQVSTPQLFYTHFYNHAHSLRLEKLLYLEPSRSPNGFFKPLLDPGGGFRSEMAVTKPFRK